MNAAGTHAPGLPGNVPIIAWRLSVALLLTGCVSTKYKMAPKDTPPPVVLNLTTVQPPLACVLHTVIAFKGPGSWKQEAYWDEYVVALTNQGQTTISFESATLVDGLGYRQLAGTDPWELEKLSRENLKLFEHNGRKIALGAGLSVVWAVSGPAAGLAALAGDAAWAGTAAAVFVAIPVFALGTGVRYLAARSSIKTEFDRRRIHLPLALPPGETRQGSLFFPVSPGPRQLLVRCQANGATQLVRLELTPLAGLHLLKLPTEATHADGAKP